MKTISMSQARKELDKTIKLVCDDREPVVVTRRNAPPVVIVSLEDYQAIEETAYLLRSPVNARRLVESIREIEAGKAKERKLRA